MSLDDKPMVPSSSSEVSSVYAGYVLVSRNVEDHAMMVERMMYVIP
jgi:hypothetical protein